MKIECAIVFKDPKGQLAILLAEQVNELKSIKRSKTDFENIKSQTRITVSAQDSTALRAAFNSITKLITVYEKSKEIR